MDRVPTALIYVLIFLGVIIFQSLVRRLQRRAERERQAEAPPAAPLEDVWDRASPVPPAAAPVVLRRPPAPAANPQVIRPRRVHPVRALLHGKRDLRRAVVLMMVLGSCRAQEPPER